LQSCKVLKSGSYADIQILDSEGKVERFIEGGGSAIGKTEYLQCQKTHGKQNLEPSTITPGSTVSVIMEKGGGCGDCKVVHLKKGSASGGLKGSQRIALDSGPGRALRRKPALTVIPKGEVLT